MISPVIYSGEPRRDKAQRRHGRSMREGMVGWARSRLQGPASPRRVQQVPAHGLAPPTLLHHEDTTAAQNQTQRITAPWGKKG